MTEPVKKRTPAQVGRYARTKGARFEREVAEAFKPLFPDARRGIGQTRCAGEVCDVEGTPLWIETKFRQHIDLQKAMVQANRARAVKHDPRPPVVIWRKLRARSLCVTCHLGLLTALWTGEQLNTTHGSSTLVHLDFEDWLGIVRRWLDRFVSQGMVKPALDEPKEPLYVHDPYR